MSKRSARREFLRKAAKTLGIATIAPMAYDSILGHVLQTAYAATTGETTGTNKMNYIHMTFPGGPPRWMFDLPLTPNGLGKDKFVAGGFGTRFNASGEVEYYAQKFNVGGKEIHLPPVWGMKLSNHDFTSLLPNTFFIRGLDMEINNHGLSNARQVAPIIGGYSIGGALADASPLPIPSIADMGSGAAGAFRSKRGLASSGLSYTENATVNPVGTLLASFRDFRGTKVAHTEARTKAQNKVLAQFERIAQERGVASATLGKMYENAIELMDRDILKLSVKWKDTVAKYRAIVAEALAPAKGSLPGLLDKAIPGAPATTTEINNQFAFGSMAGQVVKASDLRDMLIAGRTAAPQMAENFAIAELLTGEVSSAMTLSYRPLTGLSRDGSATSIFNMTHDQHNVGIKVSLINTTIFYRAFLGCMTELVKSLKAKGLFDRTIIHVSAEFNRTPRENGSGADHGFMAGNATLISGMINGVGCVGNVVAAPSMGRYKGTFGVAAHFVSGGFDRAIQVNDVALTITSMLGVDNIVTNGRSLLAPSGGGWAPLKEEAKNV